MNISFQQPIFKNSFYVSYLNEKLFYNMLDIGIKQCNKMQNDRGIILSLYLNLDDQQFFEKYDNKAVFELINKNQEWFHNNLKDNEIKDLYNASFCHQNNIINILIPNELSRIYINNKSTTLKDIIQILTDVNYNKKYTINLQVQHYGMHIYSKKTLTKWIGVSIYIYTNDDISIESKEDIEQFWKEQIDESRLILYKKIESLKEIENKLDILYLGLVEEKKSNKQWDYKIQEINKIIQNIIFY